MLNIEAYFECESLVEDPEIYILLFLSYCSLTPRGGVNVPKIKPCAFVWHWCYARRWIICYNKIIIRILLSCFLHLMFSVLLLLGELEKTEVRHISFQLLLRYISNHYCVLVFFSLKKKKIKSKRVNSYSSLHEKQSCLAVCGIAKVL